MTYDSPPLQPMGPASDPASQYTLLEKLGTGSFGTVFKAYVMFLSLLSRSELTLFPCLVCTLRPSRLLQ